MFDLIFHPFEFHIYFVEKNFKFLFKNTNVSELNKITFSDF